MSLSRSQWLCISAVIIVIIAIIVCVAINKRNNNKVDVLAENSEKGYRWDPPDTSQLSSSQEDQLISYGRDLIAHTALYLGPKGKVASISNGMNCQNCHLLAGTKPWGNNYGAVFSSYPKFRARSGSVEDIYKRVNDCMERSLDGKTLDTNSREMKAIYAYMKWLGKNVPKETKPIAAGIKELPFLDRPADPSKGREVYAKNCQRCHGPNGQGLPDWDSVMYVYPPLWGEHSYSTGAGLYRLSRFAGYVRLNMPFDAPQNARFLTDEEAWDVAAFVNSQPRPERTFKQDWPDISKKPFDHPYGPYSDTFSEQQHKYGPFAPIKNNQ